MSDDAEDQSIEDVHRDILKLRNELEAQIGPPTKRDILKASGAAIVGASAMAAFSGSAAADDGSADGEIGSSAEPALHVFTDTFHFHERTSDVSSPADGTMWYNSSA